MTMSNKMLQTEVVEFFDAFVERHLSCTVGRRQQVEANGVGERMAYALRSFYGAWLIRYAHSLADNLVL